MRAVGVGVKAGSALADLQRPARAAAAAPHTGSTAGGFVSGMTTMYFLDPAAGGRRRHAAAEMVRRMLGTGPRKAQTGGRPREAADEVRVRDIRPEKQDGAQDAASLAGLGEEAWRTG
jgi:hypothetical protein